VHFSFRIVLSDQIRFLNRIATIIFRTILNFSESIVDIMHSADSAIVRRNGRNLNHILSIVSY